MDFTKELLKKNMSVINSHTIYALLHGDFKNVIITHDNKKDVVIVKMKMTRQGRETFQTDIIRLVEINGEDHLEVSCICDNYYLCTEYHKNPTDYVAVAYGMNSYIFINLNKIIVQAETLEESKIYSDKCDEIMKLINDAVFPQEIKQDSKFLQYLKFKLYTKYKNKVSDCICDLTTENIVAEWTKYNFLPGVIELKQRLANTITEIIGMA